MYFSFFLFVCLRFSYYLKDRMPRRETQRKGEVSFLGWFTPQIVTTAQAESDLSQKPETASRSHTRVAGPKSLGLHLLTSRHISRELNLKVERLGLNLWSRVLQSQVAALSITVTCQRCVLTLLTSIDLISNTEFPLCKLCSKNCSGLIFPQEKIQVLK